MLHLFQNYRKSSFICLAFAFVYFALTISVVAAGAAVEANGATTMAAAGGGGAAADDDIEEGYCAPYNGKVCKSFINSAQVWYSSSSDSSGGWENEKITTNLWNDLISELTGLCRIAAEVISFYHFFLL